MNQKIRALEIDFQCAPPVRRLRLVYWDPCRAVTGIVDEDVQAGFFGVHLFGEVRDG